MFGDDKAAELYEKFKTDLFKVFNAYESQNSTAAPAFFSNSVAHMDVRSSGASSTDYASFVLENDEDDVQKSELETYLGEPILPTLTAQDEMNFDILVWWKMNSCKYPTLANIARDVLAMPVTRTLANIANIPNSSCKYPTHAGKSSFDRFFSFA
ncbi:zinc finger BED domain-containing protein RICESLEEPER 1-like [Papaver somniferum]|uniref:zinc finger BED domain-containing protein RICESLEEPER 1-like n=1 Tax=Papaver somniferum TaxID=3469 RepID=UPI000E6F76F5|nr:zinc finger BED domain-containing protein RICESLEEPER 1-like [Papaver somniferum]